MAATSGVEKEAGIAGSESAPDTEAMGSPRAWCQRVLEALRHEGGPALDAGHLGMLLSYFAQLDPSASDFDDPLRQYTRDRRAALADAALALRGGWERAAKAADLAPPSHQETLRTIGALLDALGSHGGLASLAAAELHVDSVRPPEHYELTVSD